MNYSTRGWERHGSTQVLISDIICTTRIPVKCFSCRSQTLILRVVRDLLDVLQGSRRYFGCSVPRRACSQSKLFINFKNCWKIKRYTAACHSFGRGAFTSPSLGRKDITFLLAGGRRSGHSPLACARKYLYNSREPGDGVTSMAEAVLQCAVCGSYRMSGNVSTSLSSLWRVTGQAGAGFDYYPPAGVGSPNLQ